MLIEQSKELTSKIEKIRELRKHAINGEAFRTRADQLSGPSERLDLLSQVLEVFLQRGMTVEIDVEKIRTLKAQLDELTRKYGEDPSTVIQPDSQLRFSFWSLVGGLPDEMEQSLRRAWVGFINQALPVMHADLLTVLMRIPGFMKQVEIIRQRMQEAIQLQQTLPQSEAVFNRIEVLARQLHEAWDQLHSEDISESVLVFLRATSSNTATLQHISPEVREWLERHNLLQAFKVTL